MSHKRIVVNEKAYQMLAGQKRGRESFSDVILRLAPPLPIKTCGELLDYQHNELGSLADPAFLKDLRRRKSHPKRSPRGSDALRRITKKS